MKKFVLSIILISVTVLISGKEAKARERKAVDFDYYPRHEIYIQYGIPSVLELSTINGKRNISGNETGRFANPVFSGNTAAGYSFMINPAISIGLDFNYSYASTDVLLSERKIFKSSVMAYTGTLSGHYIYYQEGNIEISSGVYLGVNYKDEDLEFFDERYSGMVKESDAYRFAYHLTAIKVRYGNIVGLLAELGFGFRGLVNVGLSIKL